MRQTFESFGGPDGSARATWNLYEIFDVLCRVLEDTVKK